MKRALVISGGGSKGAFAVGVLKEMKKTFPKLDFDIYVGTSAGSLVTSLASLGMLDALETFYTNIRNKDIFIEGNIVDKVNDTSIFDVAPLWKLIQRVYKDEYFDQLNASGKKICFTTVCLQTEQLNVFTNDASIINTNKYVVQQTINVNHFRRALLASCCEPVFMQPIHVGRGVPGAMNPDYQYVDGGVLEYAGIQMAIDAGAEEIFVILLSAESQVAKTSQFSDLLSILGETVDILTSDVGKNDIALTAQYNEALNYIEDVKEQMINDGLPQAKVEAYFTLSTPNKFQGKKPLKIFTIRPDSPLGGGPGGLTFDPPEMQRMFSTGLTVFDAFAANLDPGDITWG